MGAVIITLPARAQQPKWRQDIKMHLKVIAFVLLFGFILAQTEINKEDDEQKETEDEHKRIDEFIKNCLEDTEEGSGMEDDSTEAKADFFDACVNQKICKELPHLAPRYKANCE